VVLSLILPIPVIALVYFTARRRIMGALVNRPLTSVAAVLCAAVILVLNVILLGTTFGVRL
jgi:manganese transport protein